LGFFEQITALFYFLDTKIGKIGAMWILAELAILILRKNHQKTLSEEI
jgi:hypothetical protein